MEQESIRINKFISEAGVCSRREADRLIEQKRVSIDGRIASPGDRVNRQQVVCVDGKKVTKEDKEVIIAFNKPAGIVCTTARTDNHKPVKNVVDYINYPIRIYPVGRLDKESEGLLLLTNQGELMDAILRSRNHHEKEYFVRVDKPITDSFLSEMASGVHLISYRDGKKEMDEFTKPCKIWKIDDKTFRIILTQGLNRQIRRMCQYFGYRVTYLRRDRIMNIQLNGLKKGEYRDLTDKEKEELIHHLGLS